MVQRRKIKYIEDYVDEMSEHFPDINKKFLLWMMKAMMTAISVFFSRGSKSMRMSSAESFAGDGKLKFIYITKHLSDKHFKKALNKARRKKLKEDEGTTR